MRTIGGGDRNPSSGLIPADPFYLFFCYLTGKKIDEKESARGKEDEDDEEEKKKEDGLCCCGGGVVLEIEIHPPARPPISFGRSLRLSRFLPVSGGLGVVY